MKPGDMVSLRKDFVAIHVVSDELEATRGGDLTDLTFGNLCEIQSFRRGDTGIVVEFSTERPHRVKILYRSGVWWGNSSSFSVVNPAGPPWEGRHAT